MHSHQVDKARLCICVGVELSFYKSWIRHWYGTHSGSNRSEQTSSKERTSLSKTIIIATAIWGHHWKGKSVRVLLDNSATMAAINNQSSRVKESAHLLRCLTFITGCLQIQLSTTHLPGSIIVSQMRSQGTIDHYFLQSTHRYPGHYPPYPAVSFN